MNRNEFLSELKLKLMEGGISEAEINSNLSYYNSYYNEKMSLGMREEEVSQILGDPQLIARTIVESYNSNSYGNAQSYDYGYASNGNVNNNGGNSMNKNNFSKINLSKGGIVGIIIIIAIIILIINIINAVFSFSFWILKSALKIAVPLLAAAIVFKGVKALVSKK